MTQATIGANLHKAFDVLRNFTTEIAFDLEVLVDIFTKSDRFFFREVLDTGIRVDPGFGEDLGSSCEADTIDVGKADLNTLLAREVDTSNTGHSLFLLSPDAACGGDSRISREPDHGVG